MKLSSFGWGKENIFSNNVRNAYVKSAHGLSAHIGGGHGQAQALPGSVPFYNRQGRAQLEAN